MMHAQYYRRYWALIAASLCLILSGCAPTLIDVEGHRIFNPAYLFYLESGGRDEWQKPQEVLAALRLAPNAVVADIGAGGGYFTERFARHLDAGGRVYAVDVQDTMIDRLRQRVRDKGLSNVEVVKGAFDDPGLPPASCDLFFFSSVYGEIEDRAGYLRKVRRCLRPGGRVAILEYRPEAMAPGPPHQIRLTAEQIAQEFQATGLELAEEFDFLPRESFQIFRAPDADR
jgi:ubiquinone/menaquinone biosynthesis C-methylase UbiE